MLLRYASWCQLQRAPRGKLLKVLVCILSRGTHNAEVEGSSPSLTTNKFKDLREKNPVWFFSRVFISCLNFWAQRCYLID